MTHTTRTMNALRTSTLAALTLAILTAGAATAAAQDTPTPDTTTSATARRATERTPMMGVSVGVDLAGRTAMLAHGSSSVRGRVVYSPLAREVKPGTLTPHLAAFGTFGLVQDGDSGAEVGAGVQLGVQMELPYRFVARPLVEGSLTRRTHAQYCSGCELLDLDNSATPAYSDYRAPVFASAAFGLEMGWLRGVQYRLLLGTERMVRARSVETRYTVDDTVEVVESPGEEALANTLPLSMRVGLTYSF